MILSDTAIKAHPGIHIGPDLDPSQYQPTSVDLTLGNEFREPEKQVIQLRDSDTLWLKPQDFLLGHTREFVTIPADLVGRVEGKSTLGRTGLGVHITAGFIDPGFEGQITLEFYNFSNEHIALKPGMRIAQIAFMRVEGTPSGGYGDAKFGSHYQGQTGATGART